MEEKARQVANVSSTVVSLCRFEGDYRGHSGPLYSTHIKHPLLGHKEICIVLEFMQEYERPRDLILSMRGETIKTVNTKSGWGDFLHIPQAPDRRRAVFQTNAVRGFHVASDSHGISCQWDYAERRSMSG